MSSLPPAPVYAPWQSAPPLAPAPSAGLAARLAAGAAGLMVLLVASLLSLGTPLAGLLAMAIARWRARRRGRTLTRFRLWLASALGSALLVGAFFGWMATRLPADFTTQLRQATVEANQQPQPEVVRRMERWFPQPPAAKAGSRALVESPVFSWWIMVMTFTMMWGMFSLLAATPAWGGTLLLGYAVRGRWPLDPRRVPQPQADPGP
jgi:hypothetical protein